MEGIQRVTKIQTVGEKLLRDVSAEDEEEGPLPMQGALLTYKDETFFSILMRKLNLLTSSVPLCLQKQKHGEMKNAAANQRETVNFN